MDTYKIIGGDGVEYGPVSLDELRAWIVDGRVAGNTQVWRSDQSRWLTAAQYQEFYPEIGQIDALVASTTVVEDARPVGFWARVGAYLLDGIVVDLVYCLAWGIPQISWDQIHTQAEFLTIAKPIGDKIFWIQFVYTVLLNGTIGATVGKLAIRARITNLDGSKMGFLKALLRWLGCYLNMLTFGIGYLVVAFRQDKRGLHDFIASTKVVYRK